MSSGSLGSLVVSLEANIAKFQSDLGKAALISEQTMKRIEERSALTAQAFKSLGGIVAGAFAVNSFRSFAEATVASTASLKEMSEKTGASVEKLSALRAVASVGAHDMDSITSAMVKLTKNLTGTADETKAAGAALTALGIPITQFKTLDPATQLQTIAKRMDDFKEGAGKTAVALDLFGKAGADALPFLHDLAEAGELVTKKTKEQADEADRLEKNMRAIDKTSQDLKRSLVSNMVPALVEITNAMREAAKDSGFLMSLWIGLGGLFSKSTVGQFFNADGADDARRKTEDLRVELKRYGDALDQNQKMADAGDAKAAARIPQIAAKMRELIAQSTKAADAVRKVFTPDAPGPERKALDYTGKDKRTPQTDPGVEYLNKLKTEYEQLTGGVSVYAKAERDLAAMKKDVAPERAAEILDLAKTIDARKNSTLVLESESRALEAWAKDQDDSTTAITDGFAALTQSKKEQQELAEVVGMSAEKSALAVFARKTDVIVLGIQMRALLDVTEGLKTEAQAREVIEAAIKKGTEAKQAFMAVQQKEIAQNAQWSVGASRAFESYLKSVADVASATQDAFTHAFTGMEDLLVNFFTTGKADVKSFVTSILADLARIEIRQDITGPLAAMMFGKDSSSSTGGNASGASSGGGLLSFLSSIVPKFAVGSRYVARDTLAYVHEGEEITPKGGGNNGSGDIYESYTFNGGVTRNDLMSAMQRTRALARGDRLDAYRRGSVA